MLLKCYLYISLTAHDKLKQEISMKILSVVWEDTDLIFIINHKIFEHNKKDKNQHPPPPPN